MRRIGTLAIFLALCGPLTACGSSARLPQTLRGRIVAAALAQKSVHWTLAARDGVIFRADVNADSGRERATVPGYADAVEIRLVNDTIYIRGGYEGGIFVGLSRAQAARYAGLWIAVPRGHRPYRALASTLMFGSIVRHAVPRGPLEKSFTRKPHGTRLLVLSPPAGEEVPHDPPFAYRLTARASGEPLPVASYAGACRFGGAGSRGSCWSSRRRFSRWNAPVHVHAPASSTPIATIRG
jgi:hypothetical protein